MVRERGEEREQVWHGGDHGGRHGDVLGEQVRWEREHWCQGGARVSGRQRGVRV
jgi:hypothetical protein